MKILTNPMLLKMVLVLVASGVAFMMAVLMLRRVRQSLGEEASALESAGSSEQLPLHTYHAVIQQLKQQKHELQALQQAEHRRAKTSESLSAAVLSNLSSGVLFFGANGLVRQANHAAKMILGIASPVGMNAEEVFRSDIAAGVKAALQQGSSLRRVEVDYVTLGGQRRSLEVTASRVPAADGAVLGVACLINDRTEIAQIRRQIELRGEMSAEMALALRTSLITISGYAQQLAQNSDPELARQLAADVAAEAKHLDYTIAGFLAENRRAKAAATSS